MNLLPAREPSLKMNNMLVSLWLVLIIASSVGRCEVSRTAQQFEALTLPFEVGCPDLFQEDIERVRRQVREDIGPLIEQLPKPVTQPPTAGETQSTTLPTTAGQATEPSTTTLLTTGDSIETTEQSTTLVLLTTGGTTEQSTTLPTTGGTTEQSTVLPTTGQTTEQSTTPPTTGQTTEQSTTPPTTGGTTEQSTTPPTTGETTEQSTSTTTDPLYDCNSTPGWRQVVFINMTDTSYNCPPGLRLTSYSKRTCGRARSTSGCSSTTFSVGGSEYSRVCGMIRGYQFGVTSAFLGYLFHSQSIDSYYVDGVSLTHGIVGERRHIWTFAAGRGKTGSEEFRRSLCPCDVPQYRDVVPPPFVPNDSYFCDSGAPTVSILSVAKLYPDDPLWDGQGCSSTSTCCQFNNPPWFTKNLPRPTTNDIELRICLNGLINFDDVALELIELYIQ